MSVASIHSLLHALDQRMSSAALFPSLGSGVIVAAHIVSALLDGDVLNAADDLAAVPMVAAVVCAFAMASAARRKRLACPMAPLERLVDALRPGFDTRSVLCRLVQELRRVAGARGATAVLEHRRTGRLMQIDVAASARATARFAHVGREAWPTYFFDVPAAANVGHARRPEPSAGSVRAAVVDRRRSFVPSAFCAAHAFRVMYAVAFQCGDEWNGRLFLFDPRREEPTRRFVRTFEHMLAHLLPAVAGICDLYGMKRRAAANERARIARDLHDGVVQALVAVDVELELLRRTSIDCGAADQVERVQERLRTQVRGLRALLQQARAEEIDPSRLPALLADVVRRFTREAGVTATYASDVRDVRLPPAVCREVVRILQEALVNVGRHSGARRVAVRFLGTPDNVTVEVEDDGCGFADATGTDAGAPVPAVIADRVRTIGGHVEVTSSARGTRVALTLSREGPWTAESSAS